MRTIVGRKLNMSMRILKGEKAVDKTKAFIFYAYDRKDERKKFNYDVTTKGKNGKKISLPAIFIRKDMLKIEYVDLVKDIDFFYQELLVKKYIDSELLLIALYNHIMAERKWFKCRISTVETRDLDKVATFSTQFVLYEPKLLKTILRNEIIRLQQEKEAEYQRLRAGQEAGTL